jgi:hypothetical protein
LRGKIQRVGILAGFFVLALVNCGGGGGGGDDGGGGGVIADFAANCLNSDPCSTGAVTMQKGTAAGNMVEVVIWLNKLNTTIGEASLDLGFDPTVVDYQGFTKGTALDDPNTQYLVTESTGEVLADIAPPAGGKSISSPAIMIKLTFKLLKTTPSSVLSFRSPNTGGGSALYDTSGVIILTVSGWTGGVFIGT